MLASRRRPRPAVLAVDGGGSKIDAALLSRRGEVLGAARLAQADHDGTGTDSHLNGVTDAVLRACAEAGVSADRGPVADLGVYCLAGADLPADDRRIGRWLKGSGLTARDLVRNDTFAVMRAGIERTWGVAVVCGYGTNCSGVAPAGRMFRFPAVGSISGDWGGGMDVGRAALWHAMRAEDGRGPKTELARLVPAYFGVRRPRQVMEAMYFGRIPEHRLVELPPTVFRAASAGDGVARRIVDLQADEVVAMAGTAIRRLRMTRLDVDVVLGGGIFRNDDPPFLERIGDGVRSVAGRARVHRLKAPPVVGAALIGLDEIEAPAGAGARTRRELTHERMAGARRT